MSGPVLKWMMAAVLAITAPVSAAKSLYDAERYRPLVQDAKAANVGDLVTILIVEAASAESRSDTSSDADFGIDVGVLSAAGPASAGVSAGTSSGGAGRTTRSGRLQGQVSARVEHRLPSGLLHVRGRQQITINGERQEITVEGFIRPEDILPNNTVLSSRLSDARIRMDGEGWVSASQRPGLFRRLLHFMGFR